MPRVRHHDGSDPVASELAWSLGELPTKDLITSFTLGNQPRVGLRPRFGVDLEGQVS
jgi:hypothetical protein